MSPQPHYVSTVNGSAAFTCSPTTMSEMVEWIFILNNSRFEFPSIISEEYLPGNFTVIRIGPIEERYNETQIFCQVMGTPSRTTILLLQGKFLTAL